MPRRHGSAALLLAGLSALTLASSAAQAKFVDEGKLAQYCAEEAVVRLDVNRDQLIVLPVEQTHGNFHVYVQTDEQSPAFVECAFDANRKLLSVHVTGNVHHEESPKGAPKAAIKACKKAVGVSAKVLQISQLKPGYHEIILKQRNARRQFACTVADDGRIEDWVEMK